MTNRYLLVAGTAVTLIVGTAAAVQAAEMKYIYTGNTLGAGSITNPCTPGDMGCDIDSITVEIIHDEFPSNQVLTNILATATSWSISDGLTTVTDMSGWDMFEFSVGTGAEAIPIPNDWRILVAIAGLAGEPTELRTRSVNHTSSGDFIQYCQIDNGLACTSQGNASGTADGVWTVVPVAQGMELSCSGFDAPMNNGTVKVNKNRAIPLKATLTNSAGQLIGDSEIDARPVLSVEFSSSGSSAVDVTSDALPAGQGTDGNQFEFVDGRWRYNLKTKNYSGAGTYTVKLVSGDESEYSIDPSCEGEFVIN